MFFSIFQAFFPYTPIKTKKVFIFKSPIGKLLKILFAPTDGKKTGIPLAFRKKRAII